MKNNRGGRVHGQSKFVALPRVNEYPSRKEWEETCWRILLDSQERLNHIIVPYERHHIVMRAAVMHRLTAGMSYRDIGRELWLSPQTISTIKKGMREEAYRSYAARGKTERKKKVYSVNRSSRPHRPQGVPHKTKYGIVYY